MEGELQAQQGWALTAGYGQAPSAPRVCTEPHTEEMRVQPKISPRPPCCSTELLLPSFFLPVCCAARGRRAATPLHTGQGELGMAWPCHRALGPLPGQAEALLSPPHCRRL